MIPFVFTWPEMSAIAGWIRSAFNAIHAYAEEKKAEKKDALVVEKLRYVHRNPVTKGLCARPEDWKWSSFLHYATGHEGCVEIESEWTANKRERVGGELSPLVDVPHSSQRRA